MKNTGIILIGSALVSFLTAYCSGETVYLKNGNAVKGTVSEKTSSYIKVLVNGVPLPFFLDEIDKIENDDGTVQSLANQPEVQVSSSQPVVPAEQPEFKGEPYINEELGFSMSFPSGWFDRPVRQQEKDVYLEINRSRTAEEEVPGISVMASVFLSEGEEKDSFGFLEGNTTGLLEHRSQGTEWSISEKPTGVTIGDLQGIRTVVDYAVIPVGPGQPPLKNIKLVCYTFYLKDKTKMLTISLYAHGDQRFSEELREMEPAVKSLTMK